MRKAQAKKLPLAPDPKFNDKLVTRFVNNLMWEGKKSGAFTIFYDALDKVAKIVKAPLFLPSHIMVHSLFFMMHWTR